MPEVRLPVLGTSNLLFWGLGRGWIWASYLITMASKTLSRFPSEWERGGAWKRSFNPVVSPGTRRLPSSPTKLATCTLALPKTHTIFRENLPCGLLRTPGGLSLFLLLFPSYLFQPPFLPFGVFSRSPLNLRHSSLVAVDPACPAFLSSTNLLPGGPHSLYSYVPVTKVMKDDKMLILKDMYSRLIRQAWSLPLEWKSPGKIN